MNEFLEQFIIESRELAEQATQELLALERTPDDRERVNGAFRAFHTLKGGAGIVDFPAMGRVMHAAESTLSAVRGGTARITSALIGDCLSCIDQVVQWLDEIQSTGTVPVRPDPAADALVARFTEEALIDGRVSPSASNFGTAADLSETARRILEEQLRVLADGNEAAREGRWRSAARVAANVLRHASQTRGALRLERLLTEAPPDAAAALTEIVRQTLDGETPGKTMGATSTDVGSRTLRVSSERIDTLVGLTGEMVVAKNALAHLARRASDTGSDLAAPLGAEHLRLERLVASLQHAVLTLRVLPMRTVFQRFTRVVREMAVALDKSANLVVEGEDTEADKVIVEMLFEPLVHVVRNALAHGIETTEARRAAGKPVVATIGLRSYRQGKQVIVDVSDDGGGIDIARVKAVAVTRGLIAEDVAEAMSTGDAVELIFAPGFSTAREVTGLSGRGVGMDAVRSAIQRVGGRVAIESEAGRGSTVHFVLPFSVMMTQVMTVEAGGQMFGVPLDAVVETVRVPRDRIQRIGEAGAFVVRNRTVPLVSLAALLGRTAPGEPANEATAVLAMIDGQLAALEVDRLGERAEVMLKPVEGLLAGTPGIAGTTLLGDGQVLLVLDLAALLG